MRTHGFLLNRSCSFRAPGAPGDESALDMRSCRRRLDDGLQAVFNRACGSNDLDAAADVLGVLEKWQKRRVAKYGGEKRIVDMGVVAMRAELRRRSAFRNA